jgi:hypothetical protein
MLMGDTCKTTLLKERESDVASDALFFRAERILLEFVPRLESPSKDPSSSQPSTVTSLERYPA